MRAKNKELTSREIAAQSRKIVDQIVEATKLGETNYVSAILSGEATLADLFDRQFPTAVRNSVYRQLELEEQLLGRA